MFIMCIIQCQKPTLSDADNLHYPVSIAKKVTLSKADDVNYPIPLTFIVQCQ